MIATLIDILLVAAAITILLVPAWTLVMTWISCVNGLGGSVNPGPWIPHPHHWYRMMAKVFAGSVLIGVAASNLVEKLL